VLEGEAAAQTAAQARDAAGVHGHVLILGHAQRDRLLVRGEARAAAHGPAHAASAALPCRLARADLPHLDARAHPARERTGDAAQLRALLGAVGERDARAVEADLGADRARVLDAALAQQVAERQHRLASDGAGVLDALLVGRRRAPVDGAQRRILGRALDLVVAGHDARQLRSARGVADHALVPCQLEPVRVEAVHLPAG